MPLNRRAVLGLGVIATAVAATGCSKSDPPTSTGSASATTTAPPSPTVSVSPTAPPSTTPAPATSPSAGPSNALAQALTATLRRYLGPTKENPSHPTYAGAVALVTVDGAVRAHVAIGEALRYAAGPVLLPASQRVAMRPDSIFDLASITKVFTAILALRLVDKGLIDLEAPVAHYLPEFTGTGKATIPVSMLLTHTSGLPEGAKVSGYPTLAGRWNAVLSAPLVTGAMPGTVFRYSSVGLMVLGKIVEKVTGRPLDKALATEMTGPLGLRDTGFNPTTWLPRTVRDARMAATDARSSRGLLRGVVHDDVANQLGGVAGHAGAFSTAHDLAVIGQLLLDGGVHNGQRILAQSTVRQMLINHNVGLPAIDHERPYRTSAHGLGVVLNQPWFMGKLSSDQTFGHTGFTGTSLLVEPRRRLVLVLLTNRAHPNWSWADPDPVRLAVSNVVAQHVR